MMRGYMIWMIGITVMQLSFLGVCPVNVASSSSLSDSFLVNDIYRTWRNLGPSITCIVGLIKHFLLIESMIYVYGTKKQ